MSIFSGANRSILKQLFLKEINTSKPPATAMFVSRFSDGQRSQLNSEKMPSHTLTPETFPSGMFTSAKMIPKTLPLGTLASEALPLGTLAQETLGASRKPDRQEAISQAERITCYSNSPLKPDWLPVEEVEVLTQQLIKLERSNHPLVKTVKEAVGKSRSAPSPGLLVLLVSAVASGRHASRSQRRLAEATDAFANSHRIHETMIDVGDEGASRGNKMALLVGDYLVSKSLAALASICNQDVVQLMSVAFRDLAASSFDAALPTRPVTGPGTEPGTEPGPGSWAVEQWKRRGDLGATSLLGHACQSSFLLAEFDVADQRRGHALGRHLALSCRASADLEPFRPGSAHVPGESFSLTSAPVLFHLEHAPALFDEIEPGTESLQLVDFAKVFRIVSNGPGVDLCLRLQRTHTQKAQELLEPFEDSVARTSLVNILDAMLDCSWD